MIGIEGEAGLLQRRIMMESMTNEDDEVNMMTLFLPRKWAC